MRKWCPFDWSSSWTRMIAMHMEASMVHVVEAEHHRLDVGVLDDLHHRVVEKIGGGKVELAPNADDPHLPVHLLLESITRSRPFGLNAYSTSEGSDDLRK